MGLDLARAKEAERRAKKLSEERGQPMELCLPEVYAEMTQEAIRADRRARTDFVEFYCPECGEPQAAAEAKIRRLRLAILNLEGVKLAGSFARDVELATVRKLLERGEISLGRAGELLKLSKKEMRELANEWAREWEAS